MANARLALAVWRNFGKNTSRARVVASATRAATGLGSLRIAAISVAASAYSARACNRLFCFANPLDYPAAPKHQIAVVKHCCLSRCHGPLRLIEFDFDLVVAAMRDQRCISGRVLVANFH